MPFPGSISSPTLPPSFGPVSSPASPPSRHRSLSSHLLLLPQHPSPTFSAHALFRRPSAFRHRPSPAPSASFLPALFNQTELNGGPSFSYVWPNEGPWSNEGPPFDQTGPNRGPLFGPVWPNGAERKGALGAGEGRCRKAGEERRERAGAKKWREGSREGEEDGREREGDGTEEKMFRKGRLGYGEKKEE